ncbi:MAG: hypothetical protein ACM30G_15165 [Micromonosporaceae bacterium]
MRKRLLAVAAASTLVMFLWPSGSAEANHAWNSYHWARTANPFTVELDDNVTSAWDSYLNTASSDWTQSSVINTIVLQGSFGNTNCRPQTSHVEVCNSTYGNNGWLGIAQIWVSGNHITQGSTKLNDTYFNTAQYNTPAWRRLVMCQEVGHTFGLAHQDENFNNANLGSCMDYTSNPSGPPSNEHPNAHDYDQLVSIYSHLDSTNTTAPGFGGVGEVGNSPSSWGHLVSGSATQGAGWYVRDFGNGNRVITHVTWA